MQHSDYSFGWKLTHFLILGGLFAYAMMLPYQAFGVVPLSSAVTRPIAEVPLVEAFDAVSFSDEDMTALKASPETMWCLFCHTVEPGGSHKAGPSLAGIYGRPVASQPLFFYSMAFRVANADGLYWTTTTLDAFIREPHALIAGTRMLPRGNIQDDETRALMIKLIKSLGDADQRTTGN